MLLVFVIAFFILLYWIPYIAVGTPLAFWNLIQDYRKGYMSQKEVKNWKIVFVLLAITILLYTLVFTVIL